MKPIFISRPRRWWLLALVIALALTLALLALSPTSAENNGDESAISIQQQYL